MAAWRIEPSDPFTPVVPRILAQAYSFAQLSGRISNGHGITQKVGLTQLYHRVDHDKIVVLTRLTACDALPSRRHSRKASHLRDGCVGDVGVNRSFCDQLAKTAADEARM